MGSQRRKPGRPKGSTQGPERRRADLLAAAEQAVRRHGPDVSMEQIADEAGVAKATLYDNFDGKQGLADAVVERFGNRVLVTMAAAFVEPRTAHEVVRTGIDVFVTVVDEELQLFRFVLAANGNRSMLDVAAPPVTALLGGLMRRNGRDSGGAELTARSMLGGLFTTAEWWAQHRTMDREDLIQYLDDLYWPGLAAAGADSGDEAVDLGHIVRLLDQVDPADAVGPAGPV